MTHLKDRANHTTKLYWQKPYDTQFSARVAEVWQDDEHVYAVLDSTLFYPEGGGQPSDLGIIQLPQGMRFCVDHVFEQDGRIVHVLSPDQVTAAGVLKPGQVVHGQIDWDRRFDFMQQHTGQHILSRAFELVCNASTVGFHLGDDYVSIDLGVESVDDNQITQTEDLANQMVFSNLPVESREYASGRLPDHIRRRIPAGSDLVRVVYVGDFDACACGGTHVKATGEIGIIKINRLDRAHGGVRVIFRCGKRALADLRMKEQILDRVARSLSVGYQDLPETVAALSEKASGLDKEVSRLKKELLEYEIREIARQAGSQDTGKAPDFGSPGWIAGGEDFAVCRCEGKLPQELRYMARSVSELTGKTVIMFSQAPQFSLVVASASAQPGKGKKGKDIPPRQNAALLVSELGQIWGLRGGGAPQLAQMGAKEPLSLTGQRILDDIRGIMSKLGT